MKSIKEEVDKVIKGSGSKQVKSVSRRRLNLPWEPEVVNQRLRIDDT